MHNHIDVVYNSNSDGFSFNRLAYAIVGYQGPLCFLFEHEDEGKTYILGAYLNTTIKDNAKFHGTADSCLFQVSPEVKMLWTYNNEGGENYVYLNTMKIENSNLVQGLGFGGVIGEFRLWVDNDIDTKSYLRPKDKTYEIGYLAGNNNKLNL